MSNTVNIKINNIELSVPGEYTILDVAKENNIKIPTLCHMNLHSIDHKNEVGTCRVCMVEVENRKNLAPACVTKVEEGMKISTHTKKAIQSRRMALELLLSDHPNECFTCSKNLDCELQSLAAELNIRDLRFEGERNTAEIDESSFSIMRDESKCIMCRRCETACNKIQDCGILSAVDRGFGAKVSTAFKLPLAETSCTFCGQCVSVCPTGALYEKDDIVNVWKALNDPTKHVVVQTAPAVRVALGELFGYEPGTVVTGQMVSALKELGFDGVFDTNFGADLTIMEEATEMVNRIKNNGTLPILTSCCPAWVKFIEHQFPTLLEIPSTCKSPQIMFGAITKTYYAEKVNISPENIVVVSVMPCVAKKAEANRAELTKDTQNNVDFVLTTREFGKMIKEAGIDLSSLESKEFDNPIGESTGAADIFGTTGGVIEAATRTAYSMITGKELDKVDFTSFRGLEGLRKATIDIDGLKLNIGIANGLGNAKKLLQSIVDKEEEFHAIEIMACPGGCIAGGGQPFHHGDDEIINKRREGLYSIDKSKKLRKSHENPYIKKLYDDFLGEPGGHKAHELLHTHYEAKERI